MFIMPHDHHRPPGHLCWELLTDPRLRLLLLSKTCILKHLMRRATSYGHRQ